MGRHLLRGAPLLVILVGSVLPDSGWLPYLLGWRESAYSPLHSMALMPVLLIVGIAPMAGWLTEYFLGKRR